MTRKMLMLVGFILLTHILRECNTQCNVGAGGGGDRRVANGGNARNLKIVSYNVEWLYKWDCADFVDFTNRAASKGTWNVKDTVTDIAFYTGDGNRVLNRHFTDIGQYIFDLNADIVVIQEVCGCSSLEYLITKINAANIGNGGAAVGYKPWIPDNQGNQMKVGYLTRLDPTASTHISMGERGFKAEFDLWGSAFFLFGVHFRSGDGDQGTRSRDNDAIALERSYRAHLPRVIVAGDFNGRKDETTDAELEFDLDIDIATTLNTWYGAKTTISFYDRNSRNYNFRWPLIVQHNHYEVADDSDATELIGKRLIRLEYRTRRDKAPPLQHNHDFVNSGEAHVAINAMCNNARTISCKVIFRPDTRNIEKTPDDIEISGKGTICGAWDAAADANNHKIQYQSLHTLRVWTVGPEHNHLTISADVRKPNRVVNEYGTPKVDYYITGIKSNANPWVQDVGNAANVFSAELDRLHGAVPASMKIRIKRIFGYAATLRGLQDADVANHAVPTHYDCLNFHDSGFERPQKTIDYIWYGAGFSITSDPHLVFGNTVYPVGTNPNRHCFDRVNDPKHDIYSDHDPIMMTIRQPLPPPPVVVPANQVRYDDVMMLGYDGEHDYESFKPLIYNEGNSFQRATLLICAMFAFGLTSCVFCLLCHLMVGLMAYKLGKESKSILIQHDIEANN